MEFYVKTSFWLGLFGLVVKLFVISNATYPRSKTHSLGSDVVCVLVFIAYTMWAGLLAFGGQI